MRMIHRATHALLLQSLVLLCVALTQSTPVAAQGMLKAQNENTRSLRVKSLQANVEIRGAFAQTQIQTTFQNERSAQTEADFQYTVPDGAVVTYFAYWFKDEKVVARVVEKERAADIYRAITVQNRDPALIERIDKNTFRARIFPIEANADLKVEMRWVQALVSDEKGAFYTLPLKSPETGKGTLENLNVRIAARPDAGVTKVVNNYKLTSTTEQGAQVFKLSENNYRAPQDLVVRFERPMRALHASLYAAPSGGSDGFFALAITPSQNLKSPRLIFSNIATFQVLPQRLPNLRAHETYIVVGRYRTSTRTAAIALTGYENNNIARQALKFSSAREDNSLATKFWAAMQIEQLSPNAKVAEKNCERIVSLSTRFTLPSSLTSWLAVPKSEWETFRVEIARRDIERIGRQLAELARQGRQNSATAKRLRTQFYAACRVTGDNPRQQLAYYLGQVNRERLWRVEQKRDATARLMATAVANGESTKAARYRRQVANLNRHLSQKSQSGISSAHDSLMYDVAHQWAAEKVRPKPDAKKIQRLNNQLARLERDATKKVKAVKQYAGQTALTDSASRNATVITDEIVAGRKDGAKVKAIQREAEVLGSRLGVNGRAILKEFTHSQNTQRAEQIANQLVNQQRAFKPDAKIIQNSEVELTRLANAGVDRDVSMKQAEIRWSWGVWSMARNLVHIKHSEQPDAEQAEFWRKSLEEATRIQIANDRNVSVEEQIAIAEQNLFGSRIGQLRNARAAENSLQPPDPESLQLIDAEIEKILTDVTPLARERLSRGSGQVTSGGMRELLVAEHKKDAPDVARVKQIEKRFIEFQPNEYFTRRNINDPEIYGQLRVERIKVRTQREVLNAKLQNKSQPLTPDEVKALTAERTRLAARENELKVRMGDPLIQVEAPADAAQVVAIFPGGDTKNLIFNTDSNKWEVRFDVPTYAAEGAYTVSVIVVFRDGTRKHLAMRFHVDVTPPQGVGKALLAGDESTRVLRLELDADEDTARVLALLPNGEKVDLAPSTKNKNGFFALAPVSEEFDEKQAVITFILTDRAHNRTTITVDLSR